SWPLQNFTLNTIITPKQTIKNIGQNVPLYALDSQAYSMKLITQRGNSKEISINSPNQEKLDLKLIALPVSVPDKFRTTLLLTVTNNMTNQNTLLNIKPIMNTPQRSGTGVETLITPMFPSQISNLRQGDTASFMWVYEISGVTGDNIMFTVSLENGYPGNSASATVSIQDVLLSQQSQTALSATNLSSPLNQNLLIFHNEQDLTPNNAYQMYPGDPDIGGATIVVNTANPKFFTNNGTAVKIPTGVWNASLTYFSTPFPDSLMDNNDKNMVLHFELNGNPEDSTENTSGHTLGSSSYRPTFQSTGGPHSSGAFSFDGSDYIRINKQSANDVKRSPDTTSLWFKAINGINTKQILYRATQNNDDEYYEIGIDANHNVFFEFLTQKNKTPTKCVTSGFDYENNKWQHVVAVRPTDQSCQLYINATLIHTSNVGDGDGDINVDDIFIGAKNTNANLGFNGVIDDVLHWDDYSLTSGEITDLKNTNYGIAAHKVTFYMNKTNQNGVTTSNIATDLNFPLKFLDGKKNGLFLNSYNYSKSINGWKNFTDSERLVFDMKFQSGLGMNMRVDDTSLTTNPRNSFLQTPNFGNTFQSYITLTGTQSSTFRVYNSGPETMWITFDKTRLIFDDMYSSNTYAALILQANSTNVTSIQDSIAFPALTSMNLTFSSAKNPPATTGSVGVIPVGKYLMKMHIEGYDATGEKISKTINYGAVSIK
ncbi:MAG: LamG domain-containing protein, partial [Nitrosarchaeum sp.]